MTSRTTQAPALRYRLGTMGFSYSDWVGPFYPRGAKAGDFLSFYSQYFDAVELDTTFHAILDRARVEKWAAATPDDFRFCAKTPRAVTHEMPLDRATPTMLEFVDSLRTFGNKLGIILLQFAPSFTFEQFPRLASFLPTLPTDVRFAIELRDRSWGKPETLSLLHEHRCALATAEYLDRPARIIATTDFLYIRWIGEHGRFDHHEREQLNVATSLKWWRDQLAPAALADRTDTPPLQTIYGFFNNDFSGYSPATCAQFKSLLHLPADLPTPSDRGELFG